MFTIRTTDLHGAKSRTENFDAIKTRVISRSGLHPTEHLLLEHLNRLDATSGNILIVGNRTGATGMALHHRLPHCHLTCHALDLHHAAAIARNLSANSLPYTFTHDPYLECHAPTFSSQPTSAPFTAPITVACTADTPTLPLSAALFMATTATTTTGELLLDQLESIQQNLVMGGHALIAYEGKSQPFIKQINSLFGKHTMLYDAKGLCCLLTRKQHTLKRRRNFTANFTASLPGGSVCTLTSRPGVFSHRRPDNGGLALAEVATTLIKPTQRILDMGCGCGLVSLLLAQQEPTAQLLLLDSHARALAATWHNVQALAVESRATLLLSHAGLPPDSPHCGTCDLFVGNPPYFSDFHIAELFLRTAYNALRPGGLCLTVAKNFQPLQTRQHTTFGNATTIMRRGYGIVKSRRTP